MSHLASIPFRHPMWTVALTMSGTIIGALAIESAGYPPCTLCLYQRVPYYALLLLFVLAWLALRFVPDLKRYTRVFSGVVLVALLISAGLGAFHAGVEFGWWEGPKGCSGSIDATSLDNLLESLKETKAVSCTKASFWIFGLSLSVWNAIVSTTLAAVMLPVILIKRPGDER